MVVVGDSVSDRLGKSVRAVPVYGYSVTQLVLAWIPDTRPAASRLAAAAQAVMERRAPRTSGPASTDYPGSAD